MWLGRNPQKKNILITCLARQSGPMIQKFGDMFPMGLCDACLNMRKFSPFVHSHRVRISLKKISLLSLDENVGQYVIDLRNAQGEGH